MSKFLFFFFQAEDGIRDATVTGVQTCALPILRCSPDHHNLALLASSAPGFHHASFEVGGVDEIGVGAARMADRGWQPGWGFGRHVIGSNFFYYIRDPWGSLAAYFYDLDQIPETCAWEPRDFPAEDSLYS